MKTSVPGLKSLRSWIASHPEFERTQMLDDLGTAGAKALPFLIASGEIVSDSPGRYSVANDTGEDAGAQADRDPIDQAMVRLADRGVMSRNQIVREFGSDLGRRVKDAGLSTNAVPDGLVASPTLAMDAAGIEAAIRRHHDDESAIVANIDRARRDVASTTRELPERHAVLRAWRAEAKPDGRPAIERIYVEMADYPTIFAQRVVRTRESEEDIVWGSAHPEIGPAEAMRIGARLFRVAAGSYKSLSSLLGPGGVATVATPAAHHGHEDLDPGVDPAPVAPEMRHPLPCAYVVSDTERLDTASLRHPLPDAVDILVGSNQPPSVLTALRRTANLRVRVSDLKTGDFVVEGRLAFARASAEQFDEMLANGSRGLMDLAERLQSTGLHRCIFIEGGPYARRHYVLNRLASTLSYLQNVHGIHVTSTMNERHTVYAVVQAVKHHLFGMFSEPQSPDPIDSRRVKRSATGVALAMLSRIDGVSPAKAKALLERFGSLRAIALAEPMALQDVDGVGRIAARSVAAAFSTERAT